MKKLFLIFAFFIIIDSNAQQLKVDYELKRDVASAHKDFSPEFREKVKTSEEVSEKFVLYYSNGDSFFKSFPKPSVQHENAPVKVGNTTTYLAEVYKIAPILIYKKKGDDYFYAYHTEDGKEFYKKSKLFLTSVDYKEETQKIDAFVCKLVEVTTKNGDVIKIWYTEEMPISTGPFAYGDFPGLVLKIEAPTFLMYATKISKDFKESELEKINPKLPIEK